MGESILDTRFLGDSSRGNRVRVTTPVGEEADEDARTFATDMVARVARDYRSSCTGTEGCESGAEGCGATVMKVMDGDGVAQILVEDRFVVCRPACPNGLPTLEEMHEPVDQPMPEAPGN